MQQLAVHKAALSQCGVENEPSFQRMVLAQLQNIGAQLQTLDARLVLQTCWEPNAWETFVSCDVNQAAASTENVLMELAYLNPLAAEFVPDSVVPEPVGSGCETSEHSATSDVCKACRLSFGEIDIDGSWEGDACDWCSEPHHSKCLQSICNLKGSWEVCKDCAVDFEGVIGDFRSLPAADWKSIHNRFLSSTCKETEVPVDTAIVTEGWPNLDESQQEEFHQWHAERMQQKNKTLLPKLKHLSDQLGEDITSEDTCTARAKLDLARKLETALEELGTAEHLRKEAWLFLKR